MRILSILGSECLVGAFYHWPAARWDASEYFSRPCRYIVYSLFTCHCQSLSLFGCTLKSSLNVLVVNDGILGRCVWPFRVRVYCWGLTLILLTIVVIYINCLRSIANFLPTISGFVGTKLHICEIHGDESLDKAWGVILTTPRYPSCCRIDV